MNTILQQQLKTLPQQPGIYQFKDRDGVVLYVGKAKNLRSRVRSYFRKNADLYGNKPEMVQRIESIETIIVNKETEAFILENTLIKKFKPQYNISLKDDKGYLFVEIDHEQPYPSIELVRSISKRNAHYFGPFVSSWAIKRTLKNIGKLFPYRTCTKDLQSFKGNACLDYHIGKCPGPCEQHISEKEYAKRILYIEQFLKGQHQEIVKELSNEMKREASKQHFEHAANIRDTLLAMKSVLQKQEVVFPSRVNIDAIAINMEQPICASILRIRNGHLLSRDNIELVNAIDEKIEIIIEQLIIQYYSENPDIPKEILVEEELPTRTAIERWLTSRHNSTTIIHVPKRGIKRHVLEMCKKNATHFQESKRPKFLPIRLPWPKTGKEIQKAFSLQNLPTTIECYDISNIQGAFAVGSMVVFQNAKPVPAKYKRFRIRTIQEGQANDFGMLAEILKRRLHHAQPEAKNAWPLPDLFLIDGGTPQLRALKPILQKQQIDIPLIGIAKIRKNLGKVQEEFHIQKKNTPIVFPENSSALKLLTQIRDEAHRFAIQYYRKRHIQSTSRSTLDTIPGIGPKTKSILIKEFGSINEIRKANIQTLRRLIGNTKTTILRKYL